MNAAQTKQVTKSLNRFAKSDLADAKKRGCILIGMSKRGTLSLKCDDGTFSLSTTGLDARVLASGTAAEVSAVLVTLYTVVDLTAA